jgi:sarcosine oxidase subunit alpha
MGPRGSWMFYEPFIRRAAGLGNFCSRRPDCYEGRHDFADVLVIGAGRPGLPPPSPPAAPARA